MVQPVPCLRGDADIDAFYNSLLTGSGGDPPKARRIQESLACRGYGKEWEVDNQVVVSFLVDCVDHEFECFKFQVCWQTYF